jgi:hypothetical protein
VRLFAFILLAALKAQYFLLSLNSTNMVMKDERKNIKEPYHPDNTPNPPQIIDPSKGKERNEPEAPVENKQRGKAESQSKTQQPQAKNDQQKPKQVGDAPDIQDETTI